MDGREMVSDKNRLRIMDKADLEAIHGASMEVLRKVGVRIDSEKTLDFLIRHGFEVDHKTKIVKMPESLVMDAVKSSAKNFRWHGRSERQSFDFVDGSTKFGPGAQCMHYLDPDVGQVRSATLEDGVKVCRMLDGLDSSSLGYLPLYPSDVPPAAMNVVLWAAQLIHSSKPAYGGSGDDEQFEMMLRIVDILYGDRELLRKKALFVGFIDPISPLTHDPWMLQILLRYSEWNLPVFVVSMALAGGTAPASLAGLLVQQNAEILSSIAIAKCVCKAPKIVYGSVSCPLDMRSGISATGAPEFSLIGIGAVQMAKFYGLPSDVGAQSDSKSVDAQNSYEKTQAALVASLAGADMADLFLGSSEAFNVYSPIQLMIDDEIVSNVRRIAQGIEVNEETMSVDVIAKTGPMGNFLKHPRTLSQFKREHSQARLSDRSTRQQWLASGAKDTNKRARERMDALLRSHVPDPLEPEMMAALDKLLKEHTRDYRAYDLERIGH
jgi:trimethylamine--corrinoid protein Co-methyltransferase